MSDCFRSVLSIFCSLLLLSGCSGSDSGRLPSANRIEATPQPTPPASAKLLVNGNVVKGTVKNAHVEFYLLQQGVDEPQFIDSTFTDDLGEFTIEIPIPSDITAADLILIKALGQGNQQTEMVCDAAQCGSLKVIDGIDSNNDGLITFGENLYLSEAFELSTAVSVPASGDHLNVSITPLTHIAVNQARKVDQLTREGVQSYMQYLASLMNLPTTLTQLSAIDSARLVEVIANGNAEAQKGSIIYSVYSAMFAEYANQNELTIEAAIQEISEGLFTDSLEVSFDRNMVLVVLQNALEVASLYAGRDENLQALISEIRLLLVGYYCDEYATGEDCEVVVPEVPDIPDKEELQVVKTFVADMRQWTRDVTLQAEPAVEKFTNRIGLVEDIWEEDLKRLTSSLNDLLPGVAQLITPYFCGNFDECPFPETLPNNQERINLRGLEYTLDYNTRVLSIVGELDGEIDVDVDLLIPELYDWQDEQRIAITAGRLSYNDVDLLLTEGSDIVAGFDSGLPFYELMRQVSRPYLSPVPSSMAINANFLLQSEYELALDATIGFENGERFTDLPVTYSGDWQVSRDRAHTGEVSFRSRPISHRQRSQASVTFNTKGGNLAFYRSVESERSFDFFRVYLDGRRVLNLSGNLPQFARNAIYIPPGEHTVTWEYSKDGSVDSFADAAWIDNITFPPFADSDLPTEFATRTILNGTLSLSAEKLDQPWVWATKGFIPGDISINAILSSEFDTLDSDGNSEESARDSIALRLSANIANAADFIPPQALDEIALSVIGDYSINDNGRLFVLNLPQQRFEVEQLDSIRYQYREYREGAAEPIDRRNYYYDATEVSGLADVAGRVIRDSGIGWRVVVPEEGLYLSTLLGSSPFFPPAFDESRFDAAGGSVFGYLVEAHQPSETAAQYLRLSAAIEIEAQLDGLENTVLGTAFSRSSLTRGDLGFYVEYDGHRFNFESDAWYTPDYYDQDSEIEVKDPSLTITNQQGVALHIQLNGTLGEDSNEQDKETLSGEIIYNDTVYATLERVKGLTLIRYVDGSGESLE